MQGRDWCITKWCKTITDNHEDAYTNNDVDGETIDFRLLDDDGVIYCYGKMNKKYYDDGDECDIFEPVDLYEYVYGVTEIQYKIDGEYKTM